MPKLTGAWVTFLVIGILLSRGALELFLPKSLAMMLQLSVMVAALSYCLWANRQLAFRQRDRSLVMMSLAFLLISVLSGTLTTLIHGEFLWPFVVVFNLFLVLVCLVAVTLEGGLGWELNVAKSLVVWGWILLFTAVLEQCRLLSLPGHSYLYVLVRPASLTGSYLHYPIVMAILGYVALELGKTSGSLRYKVSGLAFLLAPVLAVSRSGAFIVLFSAAIYAAKGFFRGRVLALVALVIAASCIGYFSLGSEASHLRSIAERVTQAMDRQAEGNTGRINSWRRVSAMWLDSNLFIGEYAGLVTNAAGNLNGKEAPVAESGLLQMLVNFGLLGAVLFYGLLIGCYRRIAQQHHFLRAAFVASVTQTLFYQSTEVIPFITFLLSLPWLSSSISAFGPAELASRQLEPSVQPHGERVPA